MVIPDHYNTGYYEENILKVNFILSFIQNLHFLDTKYDFRAVKQLLRRETA